MAKAAVQKRKTASDELAELTEGRDPRDLAADAAAPVDHRTVTCYNRACPDYRVGRRDGSACGCKRTNVGGDGKPISYPGF